MRLGWVGGVGCVPRLRTHGNVLTQLSSPQYSVAHLRVFEERQRTADYVLLTTHYSLLATCYLLLATYNCLLAVCHLLLTSDYLLLTPTHSYLLLTTHNLLLAVYYLLSMHRRALEKAKDAKNPQDAEDS